MLLPLLHEVGAYGPAILFVLSLFLLWDRRQFFFYFLFGNLVNVLLNLFLKGTIQQLRPSHTNPEGVAMVMRHLKQYAFVDGIKYNVYGMPSGHMQEAAFITMFMFLVLKQRNWLWVYLVITAITAWQRVADQFHTVAQVVVGALIGPIVAAALVYMTRIKLSGKYVPKPDDFGPLPS